MTDAQMEYMKTASRIFAMIRDGKGDSTKKLVKQLRVISPTDLHQSVAMDLESAIIEKDFEKSLRIASTAKRQTDIFAEKIISKKYKYIWICNPKVASRSLIAALRKVDSEAELIKGKTISEIYESYPEVSEYYSFTFVRHPCYRAFSFYANKYLRGTEESNKIFINALYGVTVKSSFDDVCRWLNTPYGSDLFADRHWLSQNIQIRLPDNRLPDFVGTYENLEEDLQRVSEQLKMSLPSLPKLNTMAGNKPTHEALQAVSSVPSQYLNQHNINLLEQRYADDFSLADYQREINVG